MFALGQKNKEENNEVMQLLVNLSLNSLYGERSRKDIEKRFACKSEYWMTPESIERVKDFWKTSHVNYIVKMIDDKGLEVIVENLNTMPLHLACFVLSNSKRIMKKFIHANIGFNTNDLNYTDTNSLYIENEHWDKLDQACLVGKILLPGKNGFRDVGIFHGLFQAPKTKNCLTINKYAVIDEQKTLKGFTNVSQKLDKKLYFKRCDGYKLIAKVPLSWKSFCYGVVIPHTMRGCNKCIIDILCDGCDKLINQLKEFTANLKEFERQPPNEFGHWLPCYKKT